MKGKKEFTKAVPKLFKPFYFQLLYLEGTVIVIDENRHYETLSSGIQYAQRVLHIAFACLVRNAEGTRAVGAEKGFHYLAGLAPAGIVYL